MQRIMVLAVCFWMICLAALADVSCVCNDDSCLCFIQEGDGGPAVDYFQNTLTAKGYLEAGDDGEFFDLRTVVAVKAFQRDNGLPETGSMDDDTLTLLLWGRLPAELNAVEPEAMGLPVWIPTDGGIRHHRRGSCCDMYDPRLVSRRNALIMNMKACGRCKPDGANTLLDHDR